MGQLVNRVLRRQAEGIVTVPVPSEGRPTTAFVPNEVYLEVRIRQMWLTDERELWREYTPFATVVSEFIRRGRRVAVPTVLGAATLGRRLQVSGVDDALEVCNVRVAGPVPYEGDDVSLLVALFRLKTVDWLARSLKLVEDVAGAVGFAGLAATATVADSLVRGVESFLDMSELELRVGTYHSWSAPYGEPGSATELRPMDFAVLRRPTASAAELAELRVKDGRLHRLRDGNLVAYRDHDFILISVEAREFRDDYRGLEFYGLWEQTRQHVINGDLGAARRLWRQTAGAIHTDELIRPQQETLFAEYQRLYGDLVARFGDGAEHRGDPRGSDADWDDDPESILRRAAG
ncbi:hypothetical protein [Alloactinosynnema sp. L-07]|nr:hypothetical protein [Alloactinosynnema sp. L-07]